LWTQDCSKSLKLVKRPFHPYFLRIGIASEGVSSRFFAFQGQKTFTPVDVADVVAIILYLCDGYLGLFFFLAERRDMSNEDDDGPSDVSGSHPPVYFAGNYYFTYDALLQQFKTPNNVRLMYDYFTNPWTTETIRIKQEDKRSVLNIINGALQGLTEKDRLGHTIKNRGILVNARPLGILEELEVLKRMIIRPSKQPISEANAEQLRRIKQLSAKQVTTMLYQTAWWLLHPNKIPEDIRGTWLTILEQNKESGLDVLLRLMDKNRIKKPQDQLKMFMDLDIANPVIEKKSMKSAAAVSVASFGTGAKEMQVKLEARLQQTFEIFGALGLLTPKGLEDLTKMGKGSGQLQAAIDRLPKEIARKLLVSMDPIYKYYERLYGDAYTLIRGFMANKFGEAVGTTGPRAPVSFPIDAILTLLERSHQVRAKLNAKTIESEGLVRLTDIPDDMIGQFKEVQKRFAEYVNVQYRNDAIKTPDSPSSRLYELLAGVDTHILQFMSPTIMVPKLAAFRKGLPETERRPFLDTASKFFDRSFKNVYVVVQPKTDTKDRKKIDELKPYLYELPDTNNQDLIAFNTIAQTNTFNSLSIGVTQPDFVRSITDRSAALMVVLYFRLILEKIVPPVKPSTGKVPTKPVIKTGVPVGKDATGTGQATKTTTGTGTAGAQSQSVPIKD